MSRQMVTLLQWKIDINWLRAMYIGLYFANAIFATMFKAFGDTVLSSFGTFADCDRTNSTSCQGNQMVFRASFSISTFFLVRAALSRFGWVVPRARKILLWTEMVAFIALLVGSFYIPDCFFEGYVPITSIASGFFILFQIFFIVSVSYQVRDTLLERIERAEKREAEGKMKKKLCVKGVWLWKAAFLGVCGGLLVGVGAGITYLYKQFGNCSLGVAFTTITIVASGLLIAICVSSYVEVGLLPPCAISAYLVLMCWQALLSNPDKSCEYHDHPPALQKDTKSTNTNSMIVNAVIAAFTMTWTSWRTSSAATKLLVRPKLTTLPRQTHLVQPGSQNSHRHEFAAAVVVDESPSVTPAAITVEPLEPYQELVHEPWQFYSMMCLAGLYMAMVLTDWNSADGSFNKVSMWVKIAAQWATSLLFVWTLIAPKLCPNRDFS